MATSRLEQLLAAVAARVQGFMPDGVTVSFGFGLEFVMAMDLALPRVVWVRGADAYAPPERVGGNPRLIAQRTAAVMAHCSALADPAHGWDTADAAAEYLVDAVVAALKLELTVGGLPTVGQWLDQQPGGAGAACVLGFTVAQPLGVPTAPVATITATALDSTGATFGDGVLQSGETT